LTAHELTHTIQQGGAVPTKSVTGHQKKENKLQAKADAIQLTSVEAKIQRKENPQAQPAAAKVAPETPAASPSAKSEKGEQANTIRRSVNWMEKSSNSLTPVLLLPRRSLRIMLTNG